MKKTYIAPTLIEISLESEGMMEGSNKLGNSPSGSIAIETNEHQAVAGEEGDVLTNKYDNNGWWD